MKKIIALILVTVLCLGVFVGCKNNDAETLERAITLVNEQFKSVNKSPINDFDIIGQVSVDGKAYSIEWSCNNSAVTIKDSTKAGFKTVDLPDKTDAELKFTLTGKITVGKKSDSKSFEFTMPVTDNSGITTTPVEGTAYKLFLMQGNKEQRFYALATAQNGTGNGANIGKFVNTTVDPKAGVEFFVEVVDGGYKIYANVNNVKTYLYAQTFYETEEKESKGELSKYLGFSTENASVFYYNADKGGVWMTDVNGVKYGVGTYNQYTTMSLSEDSRFSASTVGSSQYVMQFMTAAYANTLSADAEKEAVQEPAANSTLTITAALELGAKFTNGNYTTNKYYIEGEITEIKSAEYGNLYIKDANGNTIYVYGVYSVDNGKFNTIQNAPVVGDTVKLYGVVGKYNDAVQMKSATLKAVNGVEQEAAPATPDDTIPTDGIVFQFGDNVTGEIVEHSDGAELTEGTTYTSGNYSLTITNITKVSGGANDAKGNSCLKLGTSSAAASMSFTVASDVTSVVIYAARYKSYADNNKIFVNGVEYTLECNSNDGAYEAITIDTSSTKTITITTATGSGKPRAMINAIVFYAG